MRPTSTFARLRRPGLMAAHVTAVLLFLGACASTTTLTPAITVALDAASADLIRGDTQSFTVTLTRVDGAADPVVLSIAGLPANVSATFTPASLSGTEVESTLAITAAAGAAETTASVTVTGTSGALTDQATLSLDVVSLSVSGRVETLLGRPLIGATVKSQGETDFSDATGAFTLDGLSVPYDIVVNVAAGSGALHVFEGLTSASPVLDPFLEPAFPTLDRDAAVDGTVLGGAAIAVDHTVIVCVEGLTAIVYGCDYVGDGETAYALAASWFDVAAVSVRVHALHVRLDVDGNPLEYLGYDVIALDLTDGVPATEDLAFAAVDDLAVEGTLSVAAGLTVDGGYVYARFGPNLAIPLVEIDAAVTDFDVLMPAAAGVTYDVLAIAGDGSADSFAWKRGTSDADLGELAIGAPPELVAPADAVTGVGLGTPFSVVEAAGARTFIWMPDLAGPSISLTTEREDVTVPDPALGGFAFPAGLDYEWLAIGHGGASVDQAAATGINAYFDLIFFLGEGGPGVREDGGFSFGDGRSFTFAP